MEYRQVSRKDSAMRDRAVCVEMNTVTAEATSVPVTAMAKRRSRRAGVAVFALLALIVSAVLCASSAGMTLKAYADDASSAIGIVRVDGKDYYASSFKNLREELAKQKGKQAPWKCAVTGMPAGTTRPTSSTKPTRRASGHPDRGEGNPQHERVHDQPGLDEH